MSYEFILTRAESNFFRYCGTLRYACASDHLRRFSCSARNALREAFSTGSSGNFLMQKRITHRQ